MSAGEDNTESRYSGRTRLLAAVAGVIVVAVILAYLIGGGKVPGDVGQGGLTPVRIGIAVQPTNALTLIALEQGYFAAEGLDVTTQAYPSGTRALREGLFPGEVDVVQCSDMPAAMAGLQGWDIRVLASVFSADNVNSVVARRDAGIASPADLVGKRLGTQRGSAVHFFLHLFLLEHHISEEEVTLEFLEAEALPGALAEGRIDAFSMREPYVSQAVDLLGERAVVFVAPEIYHQVDVMVMSGAALDRHPEVAVKLLRAMLRAEAFARARPQDAMDITARHLGTETEKLIPIWPELGLRVTLDRSLLLLMESQARWAADELVEVKVQPDYRSLLYPDALRTVRPDRVVLIE